MDDHTHRSNDEGHGNDSSRGDAHGGDHGHTHEHGGHCSQCRPSGSSQYGWVWMVGIIVVVAIALYVLQRNVPETSPADVAGGASVVAVEAQAPGVYNVSLPSVVPDGAIFSVDWDVSAPEETTIAHTAVHWGVASASAFGDYPNATQEYYSGEFQIPAHFETNVVTPKGAEAVYLRAHATIDGVDYVSEEFVVPVSE